MTVYEMENILSELIKRGKGDVHVIVSTDDPSVGSRAFVEICSIMEGFDWETGQIRIETKEHVVSKMKDRDNAIKAKEVIFHVGSRETRKRKCPSCGGFVRKDDRYCSCCGQRVMTLHEEKAEKRGGCNGEKT